MTDTVQSIIAGAAWALLSIVLLFDTLQPVEIAPSPPSETVTA